LWFEIKYRSRLLGRRLIQTVYQFASVILPMIFRSAGLLPFFPALSSAQSTTLGCLVFFARAVPFSPDLLRFTFIKPSAAET
jgi:hypothetical protein